MARMYSRKKVKSGSHRPARKGKAKWVDYDKDEVEKLIIKLAAEGKSAAQVGATLRDHYGVPSARDFKIRVSKIISAKYPKPVPEDMYNLLVRVVNLHAHMEKNKKDSRNRHAIEIMESKIRRLGKYYVKRKKLPGGWRYTIEQAKLLVK